MKSNIILLALALTTSTCLLTAQDSNQHPDRQRPPGREGGPGGPGAQGGFHLLPPHVHDQLQLTAEQQKKLAALEAEIKRKIEKILTPKQLRQLQEMGPPHRPGGPGMRGQDGGPGGPAVQGGPSGQHPSQRPPMEK